MLFLGKHINFKTKFIRNKDSRLGKPVIVQVILCLEKSSPTNLQLKDHEYLEFLVKVVAKSPWLVMATVVVFSNY